MNFLRTIFRTYREAYSGLPKEAWMLSMVELINRSGTMVFFFITLYLTQKLGYSIPQAGQAMSAYGFGALAGSYFGGKLTDSIGAYKVQRYSLFLTGIFLIVLGQIANFLLILSAMFITGLVSETLHPANATAMSQVCPQHLRTRGFALNRLATNLGVTIGPVVGGFLALYNYSLLFWVDGITCILAGFLFWFYFRIDRPEFTSQESAPHTNISPWKNRHFLKIMFLVFLNGLVFFQLLTTFPLYFKEFYGFLENSIGFLLSINTIIIVLFEMILIDRLRKVSPYTIVAAGGFLMAGGFGLIPLSRGFLFAAFTVSVWTVGEMLFMPALTTLIANLSDDSTRGKYMGMFSLSFSLAFIVGPSLGSYVYHHISPHLLWMFCGVIGVILLGGFTRLKKSAPEHATPVKENN
jgi:MFS family permease